MGIKFVCPNGHKLNVKDHLAGKKGLCPHCGARFQIPDASTDVPVTAREHAPTDAVDMATPVPPTEAGGSSIRGTGLMPPVGPAARPAARPSGGSSIGLGAMPGAAPAPAAMVAPIPSIPAVPGIALAMRPDPLAEAPDATWYMRLASGDQYGPAKTPEMRSWLDQSRVPPDALVWREDWADWKRADETFAALAAGASSIGIPGMPAGYPGVAPPGMAPAPIVAPGYPMPGAPVAGVPGVPGVPMSGMAAPLGAPMAAAPLAMGMPAAPVASNAGYPAAMPMGAVPGSIPGAPAVAYPMGAPMAAVPVGAVPASAVPVAAPLAPNEDPNTGEFLAAAAGQPRRSESSDRPAPPRRKDNTLALVGTVFMVMVALGLAATAYVITNQERGYNPNTVNIAAVGLKFSFPKSASPERPPERVTSPAGAVGFTIYQAEGLGYNFFALIVEVPNSDEARSKKDEMLTFGGDLAAKRIGAERGSPGRATSLSGNPGREFTANQGGRELRTKVFLIRNYLCVLGLSADDDKDLRDGVVARQFFESIKLD